MNCEGFLGMVKCGAGAYLGSILIDLAIALVFIFVAWLFVHYLTKR